MVLLASLCFILWKAASGVKTFDRGYRKFGFFPPFYLDPFSLQLINYYIIRRGTLDTMGIQADVGSGTVNDRTTATVDINIGA